MAKIDWVAFGKEVKRVRERQGQGLRALAREIGFDKSTMVRAEQGKPLQAGNFVMLCQYTGRNPFSFMVDIK